MDAGLRFTMGQDYGVKTPEAATMLEVGPTKQECLHGTPPRTPVYAAEFHNGYKCNKNKSSYVSSP